jgi:hypothetical protein
MHEFERPYRWCKCSPTASIALWALFLLLTSALSLPARADDAPVHRAARLSFVQGDVTIDHLDNTAGDPAQINMPLAEGARLSTGEDGQAEVEFEDGSVVRVTPNSSLGLTTLSIDPAELFHTQLTVLHGLVYAKLHASSKYFYVIDAGGELVSPVANTTVRINLDQPPATISVLYGTVQVEHASTPEADGYKKDVRAGESLTGDPSDSSRYSVSQNVEEDSWDEWNRGRDQAAADAALNRTPARDAFKGDQSYGWSDLDDNGSWYDVPGQGQVWQPTIAQDAEDFDPYGYGSWVAYPGVGYVWASGYIWGWTPFHCGHWSYWNGFGWGWSPGAGCRRAGCNFGTTTGGVFAVNIVHPPSNYHAPTRPIHEAGMLHSIPVGRAPREPDTWVHPSHEPRIIAGSVVEPIRPVADANALRNRAAAAVVTRSDLNNIVTRSDLTNANRQPGSGVMPSNPAAMIHNDSRPATYRSPPPPATIYNGAQSSRPVRPSPPQNLGYPPQNLGYPAPTPAQAGHPPVSAYPPPAYQPPAYHPPAYQPPVYQPPYTPRPSVPPSPPPASRPMPPPTPHATPSAPASVSPR